jgi:SAM-dependent methyltransferase
MPVPGPLLALVPGRAGRVLLPEVVAVAEREGILPCIRAASPFTEASLEEALSRELSLDLAGGNRRRMIRLLLGLLEEVKWIRPAGAGGLRACRATAPRLPAPGPGEGEDGEIRFLRRCLAHVPGYLRGEDPPIGFDPGWVPAWEDFLGCDEFQACRAVLIGMMAAGAPPGARVLDLCHGPGWGVERTLELWEGARIRAIDFTDSFGEVARRRAAAAQARLRGRGASPGSVEWIDPAGWRGFGDPLPFPDSSFDAVLFGCGDPYIAPRAREAVYADLMRVLAPGGKLGILTRGRPDPERRHVPSRTFRIATMIHDFSESVCAGWHGFADVGESLRLFSRLGFRPCGPAEGEMAYFGSSIWLMGKGRER